MVKIFPIHPDKAMLGICRVLDGAGNKIQFNAGMVIMMNGLRVQTNGHNFNSRLFQALANSRLLNRLTRLNFASRKLMVSCQRISGIPDSNKKAVVVFDHSDRYPFRLLNGL